MIIGYLDPWGSPLEPPPLGSYRTRIRHRLLGGSWVAISRVISKVITLITLIRGLTTPRITAHEPPSVGQQMHLDVIPPESRDCVQAYSI